MKFFAGREEEEEGRQEVEEEQEGIEEGRTTKRFKRGIR